jgi:hypothetical protein
MRLDISGFHLIAKRFYGLDERCRREVTRGAQAIPDQSLLRAGYCLFGLRREEGGHELARATTP